MNTPPNHTQSDNDPQLPAARRRHAERSLFGPLTVDERSQVLESVVRRAAPNADFFLFLFFAGTVFGLAILLDSPFLILLGAFIAPLMTPAVGAALGVALGSPRHFSRSLVALLIGALLVFATGWLAGLGAQYNPSGAFTQAHIYAQFQWTALILLTLAGALIAIFSIRDGQSLELPSFLLNVCLFAPLSAAGFGLSSGVPFLWPAGLVVFAIYLAWATLSATITLAIVGFRPPTPFGYSLGAAVLLAGVIVFIGFTGAGAVLGARVGLPTLTPSATLPPTLTLTASLTASPSPSATATRTRTATPSQTPSPTPAPIVAVIDSDEGTGVFVRSEPAGEGITTLLNGTVIHVLSEPPVEAGGTLWIRIYIPQLDEFGWVRQRLVATATPQSTVSP
jgi:uncharacterized membrane protein